MNDIIIYLLKANIALVLLYLVYLLFFRQTTFHRLNRLMIIFILLCSFVSPFLGYRFISVSEKAVNFNYLLENLEEIPLERELYEFGNHPERTSHISLFHVGLLIYLAVCCLLIFKYVKQIVFLVKLKRASQVIDNKGKKYYLTDAKGTPFTFLKWIFLPPDMGSRSETEYVLRHEQAHAGQLHTLDILLAEFICIIFWFNPFVFLLKRSLKTLHEYLADQEAAKVNKEKNDYLQILLKGMARTHNVGMSSYFYWLTIKKRIKMITKNKSPKIYKLIYLVTIPIAALIIQAFSIANNGAPVVSKVKAGKGNDVPCISPIANEKMKNLTSGFGMRKHPTTGEMKMHKGVDFSANMGTPVLATADGVVVKMEFKEKGKGYGRVIIIKHNDIYSTLYSQLSAFKVAVGEKVKQGQVVGLVGSSGISTGPHLHYEVRKNGEAVDPADYLGMPDSIVVE